MRGNPHFLVKSMHLYSAIPILLLLFSISTSSAQLFTVKPDSILNKLVENKATFLEKKKIMESIKSIIGVSDDLSSTKNLRTLIENDKFFDNFDHFGGETGIRVMSNLMIAYKISKNKKNFLDFLDIVLKGVESKHTDNFSIWYFLHEAVRCAEMGMSMEDVREAYINGAMAKSIGQLGMENMYWTLGLEKIPVTTTEVVTTEAKTTVAQTTVAQTTDAQTTEGIVTSTDASAATDGPNGTQSGPGGTGQSSYPPIDPDVLANLNTARGQFYPPNSLPDGTPLSDLPEQYAVYKGINEFSRVVANKHGYFVIHPVQTDGNKVMFDPYTIGQVMGYIYEYEEFKGVRPQGGWTIEMMGDKRIPTAVKRSSRRATLIFTKKSEEQDY
ncbi:hypothetical protein CAEBREN_06983 [Caenorhabditis brenneri]|uniref:Uncharacterized protein n=1 Tax=Caenorhabditis brenneri TaxID=135651 RepID=G0N2F8_CAEBE|nr:hypothetical protein CAEBREN_06983 [Caenorhabditis brenneri]